MPSFRAPFSIELEKEALENRRERARERRESLVLLLLHSQWLFAGNANRLEQQARGSREAASLHSTLYAALLPSRFGSHQCAKQAPPITIKTQQASRSFPGNFQGIPWLACIVEELSILELLRFSEYINFRIAIVKESQNKTVKNFF